jgi:translation elongation factor EF-G
MQNAAEDHGSAPQTAKKVLRMMKSQKALDRRRSTWKRLLRHKNAQLVAWGPQKMNFCGNLLIDVSGAFPASLGNYNNNPANQGELTYLANSSAMNVVQEAIISGFELGTSRGPMADEPMFGIAFIITSVSENLISLLTSTSNSSNENMDLNLPEGVFTGHIVSSVAQGCRQCFLANTSRQRIVEPVYECLVYSSGQTRGRIYSLLHRRRASIGEEILQEGTDMFYIKAFIPATESFGLQDELRTLTSGAATAQLRVDHWEILDVDPYYKPTTREELEEQGTNIDKPNLAMTIIEQVRKRKGLYREQVVKHAEKQKFSMRGA